MYFKDDVIRCVAGVEPNTWSILSIATSSFFSFFFIQYIMKRKFRQSTNINKRNNNLKAEIIELKIPLHLCELSCMLAV